MASRASIEHGQNVRKFILGFVGSYVRESQRSPSYAEIAAASGICQSRAWNLVAELIARGYMTREPGTQRTLRVVRTEFNEAP